MINHLINIEKISLNFSYEEFLLFTFRLVYYYNISTIVSSGILQQTPKEGQKAVQAITTKMGTLVQMQIEKISFMRNKMTKLIGPHEMNRFVITSHLYSFVNVLGKGMNPDLFFAESPTDIVLLRV